MKQRATRVRIAGEVAHRHEADHHLAEPGVAVVVRRGVLRSLVMACPDGCGDVLTINLDQRAGPPWRLYLDKRGTSLFPSVWRETGCCSHFIVWRSKIYWCDFDEDVLDDKNDELESRVLQKLGTEYTSYVAIAQMLDEIPWAVLVACNKLTRKGLVEAGQDKQRGNFRRRLES